MKDCEPNISSISCIRSVGSDEAYSRGKRNNGLGVSFGRRVNPIKDRQAERRLIIERRKKIDSLITGGLRSAGIELDDEEKRL